MFDNALLDRGGRPSAVEAVLRGRLSWVPRSMLEVYEPRLLIDLDVHPHGTRSGAGRESVDTEWRSFAGLLEAGADHLADAAAADREERRQAAVRARSLAAFAAKRPAGLLDRPAEEVGAAAAASRESRPAVLTDVSEWAVDEVMVALGLSSPAATRMLTESITLVERLPATLAALESATLSWAHAQMLCEVLAPLSDEVLADVEARLLSRVGNKTVSQLREAARRAVLRADAGAAARRLARAIRERTVRSLPGRDGMSTLLATLPTPVALACLKALEAYAEECAVPGDERTKDQRMADCLVDLLLRPGANGEPPVRIDLTVVAGVGTLNGGDEPGEVDGQPVPAVLVRELAYALGLMRRPEAPEATEEPAESEPEPEPAAPLAELLRLRSISGTALARLPRIAVIDEISGQLLALTSTTEILRVAAGDGPGLGPPRDTPGYSPSVPLQRFVCARDRRCRFPGCRAPAIRCDLDHNEPWPGGATSADNLCCLCRHHHRLSHQAPGWSMRRLGDGGLEWTTPGGERVTTHPPRYGSDDDHPPPRDAEPRPLTLRERVLGRPATPDERAGDPPPF